MTPQSVRAIETEGEQSTGDGPHSLRHNATPPPPKQNASSESDNESSHSEHHTVAVQPIDSKALGQDSGAQVAAVEVSPDESIAKSPQLGRKKLSVANLIRSFSPRSRTARAASDAVPAPSDNKTKRPPSIVVRTTFGKLKRSSLGSPASPEGAASTANAPVERIASAAVTSPAAPSSSPSAKLRQVAERLRRDAHRLKEQAPPATTDAAVATRSREASNEPNNSTNDPDSGRGFVREVRTNLEKLVAQLDAVDPRKLAAIRLGGELRGLLGKAQDEFLAYESSFLDHASKVGVLIALQNFAASLHQVYPIIERLQTAKFLLNRTFKRDVLFAFQEINSYYTSLFMELSMAVAQHAGVALPLPSPVRPPPIVVEEPPELPPKPVVVVSESPPPPPAPTGQSSELARCSVLGLTVTSLRVEPTADQLCLEAHQLFFGHGCAVNEPQARELYQVRTFPRAVPRSTSLRDFMSCSDTAGSRSRPRHRHEMPWSHADDWEGRRSRPLCR
ncbi:hypothetical protein PINS_up008670 [Pythium insidiosum]|nr:hypothetical protein PINS_up008670 [Pythium insidiosum]